jgi:hypothetical protein
VLVVVAVTNDNLPEPLGTEAGLNWQVAPLGSPVQESVTALLNPNVGVMPTVEARKLPAVTVAGDSTVAVSTNPGGLVLCVFSIE